MKYVEDEFTAQMLPAAGIQAGMRVLDVGCGHGEVARMASGLVGPSGHIVAVDHNADSLQVAASRFEKLEINNVDFLHADVSRLPEDLAPFDAVIGRRVLMYLADPSSMLRGLIRFIRPGGTVFFQELNLATGPFYSVDMPLHRQVQSWIQATIAYEGGNLKMGLDLFQTFRSAGLIDICVKAAADVETPQQPGNLASVVEAILPRILASAVTTESEVDVITLAKRLADERQRTQATAIDALKIAAIAKTPQTA